MKNDALTEREAIALGESWAESFARHFEAAYVQGALITRREGCPYPGAPLVCFAVAEACANTFQEALTFTGFNAEERLAEVKRRLRALDDAVKPTSG